MEQVNQIKNSFVSPVSRSKGVDLSSDLVVETELVDFVNKGPSGDDTDFTIEKKPIVVAKYHLNKVIAERSKGCSLKEIVHQCEKTGDYTIMTSRKVVFGDGFITPSTLGDALDLAEKGAQVLDGMSEEEREKYLGLSKLSKAEFDAYIKAEVQKQLDQSSVDEKKEGE